MLDVFSSDLKDTKGRPSTQKWMFLLENFRRGGGSFPIQKITLQILLVSKRYILERKKHNVISKKGGRGGGVITNPKNFIANLRILNEFSGKKRNVISKKGRRVGGSRPFGSFPKKHSFLGRRSPLS